MQALGLGGFKAIPLINNNNNNDNDEEGEGGRRNKHLEWPLEQCVRQIRMLDQRPPRPS